MLTTEQIQPHITGKLRDVSAYRRFGDALATPRGKLYFQDNGADILAVGHLDTVAWNKRPKLSLRTINQCPQLDDRLGVATILEWLPTVAKFDVLLCDLEESCNSTAEHFKPPREYRYAVEFDRAGSDCVLYQYSDGELDQSLEYCGIETGYGSYSDIASLDANCQCVNWGIGYHLQHTKGCYANLCEVNSQLVKFANWLQWFGDRSFPYVEPPPKPWKAKGYDYRYTRTPTHGWQSSTFVEKCIQCGNELTNDELFGITPICDDCSIKQSARLC